MADALVTSGVLRWARARAGATVDAVASRLKVSADDVESWEDGRSLPSFAKARDLARFLGVPLGYLYLDQPPAETLSTLDLRRLGHELAEELGADFLAVYHDAKAKQAWYREHLIHIGAQPRGFVGSCTVRDDVVAVAARMRDVLGITPAWRRGTGNWEGMFRGLVAKTETAGVLVLRNSVVGNNTHRPLSVNQFRGFALSDDFAPLVFINTGDAQAAQIFTLAHELVHIWLNVSAISNYGIGWVGEGYDPIEVFCNAVAAEFLVSRTEFMAQWNRALSLNENVDVLSREFRVSGLVIARRALDLAQIDRNAFQRFYAQAAQQRLEAPDEGERRRGGGPDFYRVAKVRNSPTFARAVLNEAFEGRMLLRDAGQLLSVKPSKLKQLAKELGE
jgi:Zn-dependent peptidase ImmA (M78 family)/transcriptional regulator with XRE-family HTH domain